MPAYVRRRRPGEFGKEFKVVEATTGEIIAEFDHGQTAYKWTAWRNYYWLRRRLVKYKGKWGIWVTTRTGKKVFIPLEKIRKKFVFVKPV